MYSVRLPLQVNANMRPVIEKRFRILAHISNQTRKRAKHLLSKLKHDELYQQMLQEYIRLKKLNSEDKKTEADIRRLKKALNETREAIGLTKSGIEAYAAVMQRRYKKKPLFPSGAGRSFPYMAWSGSRFVWGWKRYPLQKRT